MADEQTEEVKTEEGTALDEPRKDVELVGGLIPVAESALRLWKVTQTEMEEWEMETFVSSITEARAYEDISHWLIGKFAAGASRKYGEGSIGEIAKQAGFARSTVYGIAKTYQAFEDAEDQDKMACSFWFYYLVANYAKVQPQDRLDWILKASNENWTYEKLKYELDLFSGKILPEGEGESSDKPKIIECEICGGYRIINTDKLCTCDEPTAHKHIDETDEDLGDALADEPKEGEAVEGEEVGSN